MCHFLDLSDTAAISDDEEDCEFEPREESSDESEPPSDLDEIEEFVPEPEQPLPSKKVGLA